MRRRLRRTKLPTNPRHTPQWKCPWIWCLHLRDGSDPRDDDVPIAPAAAGGTHQIDLSLAPIAAGEYLVEITARGASGEAKELIPLRVGSSFLKTVAVLRDSLRSLDRGSASAPRGIIVRFSGEGFVVGRERLRSPA